MTLANICLPADVNGHHLDALNLDTDIDIIYLGARTAKAYTVPNGVALIVLSANEGFYARKSGPAVIPTGDVVDGSGAMFNPDFLQVKGGDTLSFISPVACIITMPLYKIG